MDLDYGEIQAVLEEASGRSGLATLPNFSELVSDLLAGGEGISARGLIGVLWDSICVNIAGYQTLFLQIAGIVIGAAVLKGMTESSRFRQVGETGFLVSYLLLFGVLLSGFLVSYTLAEDVIHLIIRFMKTLVPTYFLAVAFCTGSSSALIFYQGTLLAIAMVEMMIGKVLLPLVNIYLILRLVNYFSEEEIVQELAELIRQLIVWGAKTLMGLVIGIQTIQGLLLPMSDKLKRSALYHTAELLPGVGSALGGLAETVLGTGLLVKNAVGVAGLIVLILVGALPLIKLVMSWLVCKLSAGVLQPVSDKRITESLSAAAEAERLLLYLTGMTLLLFALTVALVAVSTNGVI